MRLRKKAKNRRKKEPLSTRLGKKLIEISKVGIGMAIILSIAYGGWETYKILLASPLLEIRYVDVRGVDRLSREDVINMAGIVAGDNLIAIDSGMMAKRLMMEPWIDSVTIKRHLPDRVVIDVKEREAAAIISLDGLYLIDSTGIIFKRLTKDDDVDLPIITGLTMEEVRSSDKPETLLKALYLVKILSERREFAIDSVSEIHIDKNYGLTVYTLKEGVRIALGDDTFNDKLDKIEKIISLRHGNLRGIESIDMNNPRGIIVRVSGDKGIQI